MSTRRSSQPSAASASPAAPASPRSTRGDARSLAAPAALRATRGESVQINQPTHAPASAASPRAAKGALAQDGRADCEALSTSEMKVVNLGRILNQPAFHSKKFIYPVDYKSQYLRYPSVNDPSQKVAYTCWVEEQDHKPLFIVQCCESPIKFTGSSPTAAWEAVEASLSEMRRSSGRGGKREIDGMALFGFSNALVAKAIAKLPGADEVLAHYAPKPPPIAVPSMHTDSPKRGGAVVAAEAVFSIFNKKNTTYKKPPPLPKLAQGSFRWLEANLEAFEPPICGNKAEFRSVDETLEALQSMWQAVAIVNFCRTFKAVVGLPFHMSDLATALFDAPSSILLRHLHLRLLMPDSPKNDTRELCDKENAWLNMLHARLHLPLQESDVELRQFANLNPVSTSGNDDNAAVVVQAKDEADNEDADDSDVSGPEQDGAEEVDHQEYFWSLAFDEDPFPGDPSSWYTLPLWTKINILLLLCEEALGSCDLFRSRTAMDEDAEDVRGVPVCVDKDGAYFWYMADDSSAAIYKEVPPRTDKKGASLAPGSCHMSAVCNSVEDMAAFATSLKRSKHNDEKRLSEFLLNEEIPRLEGIALSKERAERRQMELELMPRKRSSRIQEVTIKKTREEEEEERRREEERKRREEKEARRLAAEAKAKEEERRLRAEAREAERIKEEDERKKMEQERAALRARRLMEREGLLRSDRLHSIKSSGSGGDTSEVSSPVAAAGPSLDFQAALIHSSDINSVCHADTSGSSHAHENGASTAKKPKIKIQASTPPEVSAASPNPTDIQKVVPDAADLLALAIEIKRDHPGCGVKKVLSEMLRMHPDWAITEHRVGKLLHENGLMNIKKGSGATANTVAVPANGVADIHFDILSLPVPHCAATELWQGPPSPPSPTSGSPKPSSQIIDLDKLFKSMTEQHASYPDGAFNISNGTATAATESSQFVDLGKLFAAAAVPANVDASPMD